MFLFFGLFKKSKGAALKLKQRQEVEVELFTGETEELVQIGQKLQDAYGLTEENKSKYYRGMLMIKENRK